MFGVVEGISARAVRGGTKEGGYGGKVWGTGGTAGGEELVEEGGRAIEEGGFGAVVEVGIGGAGLGITLGAV